MGFSVCSTPSAITAAINLFSRAYHADFFEVRGLAKPYLASPPIVETAAPLAAALSRVLINWGAGKRVAPKCQPVAAITQALTSNIFHGALVSLQVSASFLAINGERRSLDCGSPFVSVTEFDDCLMNTLGFISATFLVGNTNATYPMKSLLLITGLMPAFDSQVKGGLAVAGVTGVKKTRYLLPKKGSLDARKICAVPFYIADCISRHSPVINAAISASKYPTLADEKGRIFDVLLFEQNGLTPETAIVTFTPPTSITNWYSI